MKIKASKIFIEGQFVRDQMLHIENGRIQRVAPQKPDDNADFSYNQDQYVIPGLIDLHIHGANGADAMDGTFEALNTISQTLAEEGVTGFLATTMTESMPKIEKALRNIKDYVASSPKTGAEILGIHLEGPFLSREFMGAQCGDFIVNPDNKLLAKLQDDAGFLIKLLTLAPELPNAIAFIKKAGELGIVISIGHTNASFEETEAGIDAGARYATHLFNAMSGVHHRKPGAAAAILYDDRISAELIADGHHVVPSMLKFAVKCKGLEKLTLVTDAMRAKCLKSGEYDLGGQIVVVDASTVHLKRNGVLAGSVLRLNGALRNFIELTDHSLEECLPMVTSSPAKILKMDQDIGTLAPSKKANLVVLNNNLDVLTTFREGQVIYKRS